MKRIILLVLSLVLVLSLAACGEKSESPEAEAEDKAPEVSEEAPGQSTGDLEEGVYFAMAEDFGDSGWKSAVTLEVKDGKIVSADWNGVNIKAGLDKKSFSKEGLYGMKEFGGAEGDWHEEAEKAEAYLLETQDPTAIEIKSDGTTDAISGVTIGVSDFFELAKKALAQGPVEVGAYEDGAYHAEASEFDNDWKATVDLTVLNGHIVNVYWDAINEEDPELRKKDVSAAGDYGMKEFGGAQGDWHEEAAKAEAHLLETQDPRAIELKDDGTTDAISGVTIGIDEFLELVIEALEK